MNKLDDLAEALCIKFQREIPSVGGGKAAKLSTTELQKRLNRFYAEARNTRKDHKLWIVSWARVVLKLKDKLLQAGYPADFVSQLIKSTLFQAAKAD